MTPPRNIVFVGAETDLRLELQDQVANRPDAGRLTFARGFLEAMAILASTPCDAIVADLALPGFNGAQLLGEVMHRYPRTLRFLLAETHRLPASPRASGAAHQVLLKPQSAERILAVLSVAFEKETWFPGEQAQRLLARMPSLPIPPELYFQIEQARQEGSLTIEQFESILSTSPPHEFHLRRLASQIEEPDFPLSLSSWAALCLLAHVRTFFDLAPPRDCPLERWESEGLLAARFSSRISQEETPDLRVAEQAFLGGLMHDLGSLLLSINVPERYATSRRWARQKEVAPWEAEQEVLGASHADIGACMLSQWGLPWTVVEAVALHHSDRHFFSGEFTAAVAVHAATSFVEECYRTADPLAPERPATVSRRRSHEERTARWRQVCIAPALTPTEDAA